MLAALAALSRAFHLAVGYFEALATTEARELFGSMPLMESTTGLNSLVGHKLLAFFGPNVQGESLETDLAEHRVRLAR